MNELMVLGILMVTGFLVGKLINRFRLPAVTGYLVAGLLIGPSVLRILSEDVVAGNSLISDLALSVIAFTIGREFRWDALQSVGKGIAAITVIEGTAACLFVVIGILLTGRPIGVAMIFGAIATATAPAATVVVMRELRSAGPLTSTLLQVVALDDAVGLMIFGLFIPIARSSLLGRMDTSLLTMIGLPVVEIVGALVGGALLGLLLGYALRFVSGTDVGVALTVGTLLLGAGLAARFSLSPLLFNMALGMALVNANRAADQFVRGVEQAALVIYVPFFVLAGASLHLSLLPQMGGIGVVYLLARSAGKLVGAFAGARVAKMPRSVQQNLGLALQPQAGVAIGMTLMIQHDLPELAALVTTVVLGSVMVYELIGPICAKIAVTRAGEVGKAQPRKSDFQIQHESASQSAVRT